MNVPQLRFSGFDREWEEQELNELLEFKNGINADKDSYGYGTKFINVLDILNNDYILSDKIIGSVNASEKQLETYAVTYGDMLFLRSSETREDVGICNVYLDQEKSAVFGGFVIRGKKIADYSPFFLKAVLNNSSARNQITSKAGGSTRYNVGQSILSEVTVRVPQIEEQQKISSFFILLNKKIETQQEKIEKLEQFKKGMMQKIFSQELRFKDEDGGEFGEWENKRLGQVAEVIMGQSPKGENYSTDNQNTVLIQGNADMKNGKVIPRIYTSEITKTCLPGDIIMSVRAPVGEIALTDIEACIGRGVCAIRGSMYIYHYLSYFNLIKAWNSLSQGSTFESVNGNDIKTLTIPAPSLKGQEKIADYLTKLEIKAEKEKEKLMVLEEQKKGFMQGMFV
ncbi:restriction modification system DNA specificity domain-containing protein [Planococcus antarcticus DSM 14505]|uniref:Restriction modification system DNA specificity domain-containing protein n=1 Tax=Planococcus antarcticus DSM 14505 TaxID=1185653 RepID=A0AA87LV23_9BACL|nr:restriction endonuclease subunit S [Planococcus antarcticus]EIM07962.1 restriction modification system DNA specificity domain-containing protein [Planococcus antarcticus DSM 14505]